MSQKKKQILMITSFSVLIVCLTVFGIFNLGEQGKGISESQLPLSTPVATTVQFASYRMAEGIPLTMTATSAEKDLNISILDEDLLPVRNVEFEVVATPPEGDPIVLKDEEGTGKIYVDNLEPGEYTLTLQKTGRFLVPEPLTIEVKAEVERKVIADIGDKLVNAKNVDAASEDAKFGENQGGNQGGNTPPLIADTVKFVESKTVTTKIDETVPLMENGVQVYKYKPILNEFGQITLRLSYIESIKPIESSEEGAEGETTPFVPPTFSHEVDAEGYLTVIKDVNDSPVDRSSWTIMFELEAVQQFTVMSKDVITYYGWQTIDGKTLYYNENGKPVSGTQVIQGMSYEFDSKGILQPKPLEQRGIDISTWQSSINWTQVKNSGIHFAMIRAGYRGYTKGALVEDDMFRYHAQGAQAAGVKVGLYYFSQAISTYEAVQEASAAISIAQKYGISVTYPIAIDIEYVDSSRIGRGDWISGAQRTANAKAFCDTIRNAGYTPMVYSSKSWFENTNYLDINQLSQYRIWVAHWATTTSYNRSRLDIWQYTSSGSVPGINGRVDMNISYLGY